MRKAQNYELVVISQGRRIGEPLNTPPERKIKPQDAVQTLLKQVQSDEKPKHPLAELGIDQTPINRALAIMEHLGRYSYRVQGDHNVHQLDGKPASPGLFITEANAVLKAAGLPQFGPLQCRS